MSNYPPSEAKEFNKYLQEPTSKRLGYYSKKRFMYDYGRFSKRIPNPPEESFHKLTLEQLMKEFEEILKSSEDYDLYLYGD